MSTECYVTLYPATIRGAQPDPDSVGLADFVWETPDNTPAQFTCPRADGPAASRARRTPLWCRISGRDLRRLSSLRPVSRRALVRRPVRVLHVSRRQIAVAQLRQVCAETQHSPPHLRPAVEVTMRSLKHPFGGECDQLPVRGLARVTMTLMRED